MKRFAVACVLLGCVLPAPYARAGGPAMLIGAAEDSVRQPTLAEAKAEMDLLVRAGFNAVRVTQIWAPGQTTPSAADRQKIRPRAEDLAGEKKVGGSLADFREYFAAQISGSQSPRQRRR